jgi:hypothetical protein
MRKSIQYFEGRVKHGLLARTARGLAEVAPARTGKPPQFEVPEAPSPAKRLARHERARQANELREILSKYGLGTHDLTQIHMARTNTNPTLTVILNLKRLGASKQLHLIGPCTFKLLGVLVFCCPTVRVVSNAL